MIRARITVLTYRYSLPLNVLWALLSAWGMLNGESGGLHKCEASAAWSDHETSVLSKDEGNTKMGPQVAKHWATATITCENNPTQKGGRVWLKPGTNLRGHRLSFSRHTGSKQ